MSTWRVLLLGSVVTLLVGCQSSKNQQPSSSSTTVQTASETTPLPPPTTATSPPLLTITPSATPTLSVAPSSVSDETSKASPRDTFGLFGINTKKKPNRKREKKEVRNWSGRGLTVLSENDKWEDPRGSLEPPCVIRTESPTHVEFGNRGKLTLGQDARVAIGKDWTTVKILAGVFVIEAGGELVTVIDSANQKFELENGILMVTKYPDRNEYHVVAGEAVLKDTVGAVGEQVLGPYDMAVTNGADSFMASWSLGGGAGEMILIFGVLTAFEANPMGMWDNHPAFTKINMTVFGEGAVQSQVPTMNVGGSFRSSRKSLSRKALQPKDTPLYRLEPKTLTDDLEARRLSWEPRGAAPLGVEGYYLELRRSSKKELLWAGTCEETSVSIPDYVTLKPGGYDWKVYPVTEKGIVHKQTLGHFTVSSGS